MAFNWVDNRYLSTISSQNLQSANGVTAPNFVKNDNTVQTTDVKEFQNQTENKDDTLKNVLIGLGVIGAAGIGIALALKGKKVNPVEIAPSNISGTVDNIADDFQKGVKKFFDAANSEVKDVSLTKGKALLPDGSGFSGVLKTANAKGEKIELLYQDGFITKSIKDGNLFKEYIQLKSQPNVLGGNVVEYARDKGVEIVRYAKDGTTESVVKNLYDDTGKVRRSLSNDLINRTTTILDFNNGRISAKGSMNGGYLSAQVFDEQGKVIKTIKDKGSSFELTDILPDGSRVSRTGHLSYDRIDTPIADMGNGLKIQEYVEYAPGSDDIVKSINVSDGKAGLASLNLDADGVNVSMNIPLKKIYSSHGIVPRFAYIPNKQEDTIYACLDELGNNTAVKKANKEQLAFLSEQIKSLIQEAKDKGFEFPYEKAEEYLGQLLK